MQVYLISCTHFDQQFWTRHSIAQNFFKMHCFLPLAWLMLSLYHSLVALLGGEIHMDDPFDTGILDCLGSHCVFYLLHIELFHPATDVFCHHHHSC